MFIVNTFFLLFLYFLYLSLHQKLLYLQTYWFWFWKKYLYVLKYTFHHCKYQKDIPYVILPDWWEYDGFFFYVYNWRNMNHLRRGIAMTLPRPGDGSTHYQIWPIRGVGPILLWGGAGGGCNVSKYARFYSNVNPNGEKMKDNSEPRNR